MTTIDIPVFKFFTGDNVRKVGGTYEANGVIVGHAVTTRGDIRYVFEFADYPGMLHIFNEGQLEHADTENSTI